MNECLNCFLNFVMLLETLNVATSETLNFSVWGTLSDHESDSSCFCVQIYYCPLPSMKQCLHLFYVVAVLETLKDYERNSSSQISISVLLNVDVLKTVNIDVWETLNVSVLETLKYEERNDSCVLQISFLVL